MPLAAVIWSLRVKLRKKEDFFKLSREGCPNLASASVGDKDGCVSTDETLKRVHWVKLLATGPTKPLENRRKLCCMICKVNVSMLFRGVYEIKRHYQSAGHLRQDQPYRNPLKLSGENMLLFYMVIDWQLNVKCAWTVQHPIRQEKDRNLKK